MGGVYSGLYLTVAAGIVHGAGSTASQAEGTHSLGSIACISLVYSPNLGGAWGVDTNSIYLPGACSGAVLGDCGAGCGLGSGVKCHVVLCRVVYTRHAYILYGCSQARCMHKLPGICGRCRGHFFLVPSIPCALAWCVCVLVSVAVETATGESLWQLCSSVSWLGCLRGSGRPVSAPGAVGSCRSLCRERVHPDHQLQRIHCER
jgi:hypothetical protein